MGCFKRTALKRILSRVKQITSPGWMHETSKRLDLVHWEDLEGSGGEGGGGGDRDGNTCKPMAVSFQCVTESTTI